MEAMQTLNPADVWDMVQKAIVWLAGIGIVIDLTPGIKIQPVRWLIKQLGNLMNHDLKEQLNQLENDFIEDGTVNLYDAAGNITGSVTKEEAEKMAAEVTKIVDEEGNTLANLK